MDEQRASITALVTAYARAYHATHDDPKVFDDFLAARLFTDQELAFFGQSVASTLTVLDPEFAATNPDQATALAYVMRLQSAPVTLCRSRYTEERLDKAVAGGVEQYVILGAGMDTFAFRKTEMLGKIQVFEVDHPATQAEKRRRVAAQGWREPEGLYFLPVDFAKQDLATAVKNSAYDPRKQTLYSWLGVTYYLTREEVMSTLRALAQLAPAGSVIIFDYMESDAFVPGKAGVLTQRVQQIVRTAGEPMKTGFDPATLGDELDALGLRLTEDQSPADLQERYFSNRTDGYHAFEHVHLASAVI